MIERQIVATILSKIETPEVLLINGSIQTGKTTALRQIHNKLIADGKSTLSIAFKTLRMKPNRGLHS